MWCLIALPLVSALDFAITDFNAAASPILVTGETRSFVEFTIRLPNSTTIDTPAHCYNWAETHDATIQGTTTTECKDNANITWSFEASDTSGFDLNVYWAYADNEGLFGSHWVKPDELDWASSEGIDIQFYSGPDQFVITDLVNSTTRG